MPADGRSRDWCVSLNLHLFKWRQAPRGDRTQDVPLNALCLRTMDHRWLTARSRTIAEEGINQHCSFVCRHAANFT